jgi:hypothetical protein
MIIGKTEIRITAVHTGMIEIKAAGSERATEKKV